jgi:Uma2 family endonuclease
MNPTTTPPSPDLIIYPECDGLPLWDNTKQMRWIVLLFTNLASLHRDRVDVFVASNLLWYPVECRPDIRSAPDVLVVFGRPKGDRGSYKQWEEGGLPPTVVFEFLSPSNTVSEMDEKLIFYEKHGVEEYYIFDPDTNRLMVYVRSGDVLRRERQVKTFTSPRLGIRFDLWGPEMTVLRSDGQAFLSFEDLEAARSLAVQEADVSRKRASRLAELSRKARRGQASAEELRELEQLEDQSAPPSA